MWSQKKAGIYPYKRNATHHKAEGTEKGHEPFLFVDMAVEQVFAYKAWADGKAHLSENGEQKYKTKSRILVLVTIVLLQVEKIWLALEQVV